MTRFNTKQRAAGYNRRQPMPLLVDAIEMWRFAAKVGIARQLKALHRPRPALSFLAAAVDWMLIAVAAIATSRFGWVALPFALLVVGNRQRALGNLLHDASHWSLYGKRKRSELLANILFCWPLTVSMVVYRDEHERHHRFLGDRARDPDYIHDESHLARGWLHVWWMQIRSPTMFTGAVLGTIGRMDGASLLGAGCWWATVLAAIAVVSDVQQALMFFALWITAKATVFHAITAFREISDHVGLVPGSLIGFSRNHPFSSVLGEVIHPHHNGYHLLHHLTPAMPFHALPRAHALLMQWPPYAAGEHCDSYFAGRASAIHSWIRRWVRQPASIQ